MTRKHPVFRGSITALPTPFRNNTHENGQGRRDGADLIDFAALHDLAERQVAAGTDGLVIGGSTGESATLTQGERGALFEYAVGVVRGRVPVIAGVGATDTHEACALAAVAERAGVDGLLVTTPAYSRPTQAGLLEHFRLVAKATALPIALYNIPARTAVDLLPETAAEIAQTCSNVVAIKEASDKLERLRVLIEETSLVVLCGEDHWIADAMELGAAGVIGVVSNLVPDRVAQLVHSFDLGDEIQAEAPNIVEALTPLIRTLGLETNPAPLKAALELMGLARGTLRLPLVSISEVHRAQVEKALGTSGLLP